MQASRSPKRNRRRKPKKTPWQRFAYVMARAFPVLLVIGLAALVIFSFRLQVDKQTIVQGDLPEEISQLKIVYLSDLHKGYFYGDGQLDALVTRVNAQKPDLVLFGGDYSTDVEGAIDFFNNFPGFHSRYGFYAVLGDADRTDPKGGRCEEEMVDQLRNVMGYRGVNLLVNETASVRIGSKMIYIAGVDDAKLGSPDCEAVAGQFKADDYVILLMHSPAGIDAALREVGSDKQYRWFDLLLSGHTHGGQIALLGQGLGISNVPDAYLRGWSEANKAKILVSCGVGCAKLPLRLGVRPQIHVITVRNKD